jgi:hypothetical protein
VKLWENITAYSLLFVQYFYLECTVSSDSKTDGNEWNCVNCNGLYDDDVVILYSFVFF